MQVLNLTAAINMLFATRARSLESLSVFIIQGFSPCLKRLIPLHPGCRDCLNFPKLSPPLLTQHQQQKKTITKIAAVFSFSPLLYLFLSAHPVRVIKRHSRFNKGQILSTPFCLDVFVFYVFLLQTSFSHLSVFHFSNECEIQSALFIYSLKDYQIYNSLHKHQFTLLCNWTSQSDYFNQVCLS